MNNELLVSPEKDRTRHEHELMRGFVLIAASVVVVEIMGTVFESTRAFIKSNGEFGVGKTLWIFLQLLWPISRWIDVQAANAVAIAASGLMLYILYYMRVVRTDDLYEGKYGVFLVLFDVAVMLLFISLARSTINLAPKSVVQEDTAWSLAIIIYALLIMRELFSYRRASRRRLTGPELYDKRLFYITMWLFCVTNILLLYAGKMQADYVCDFGGMMRAIVGIEIGLTAATVIGIGCLEFVRPTERTIRSELVLYAFLVVLLVCGAALIVLRDLIVRWLIVNRIYYAGGGLPLMASCVGVPYLVWLQMSIFRGTANSDTAPSM